MENITQENATENGAQQEGSTPNESQQDFQPIDRESFLKLPQEEQKQYKEQRYNNLAEDEKKAMEQGWSPAELLNHVDKNGNPKKGISAKDFLDRGEQIKEITISNYKKTNGELEAKLESFAEQNQRLQDQIKQILDNQSNQFQSQKESRLQSLEQALSKAKEDLEVDKALELQQEILKLKSNPIEEKEEHVISPKEKEEKPLTRNDYPELTNFWDKYPFLDPFSSQANKPLIYEAEKIAENLINQGKRLNDATVLEIEGDLKNKYPAFFPQEKKQNISVLNNNPQGSFVKPSSPTKADENNLTKAEKSYFDKMVAVYNKTNPQTSKARALGVISNNRKEKFNKTK